MPGRHHRLCWILVLLLAACSHPVEPGLYQVLSGEEERFLRIGVDSLGREEAVLYRNVGSLWADTLRFDLQSEKLPLRPYEVPEFNRFPQRDLYLEPLLEVGETRDITYGRLIRHGDGGAESTDLTLDLYYPRDDRADTRPLLVTLHGGAFSQGDKRDSIVVEWCRHFASLGYIVSSVNYRLGYQRNREETDDAMFQALKDAHASVRFLLKRDSLQIHTSRIFASGFDAGAITALNLAYLRDENLPDMLQEGVDSVMVSSRPSFLHGFDIRAVANLWGAVPDSTILLNAKIPVISYQSREDAVVPFGAGYPYEEPVDDDANWLRSALEALISMFIPETHPFREMYGAKVINRVLKSQGVPSELHSFQGSRHDLIVGDDGQVNYPLFDTIKEQVARFFYSRMETSPISLRQDPEDPQLFVIDDSEVDICQWQVEGGVILGKSSDTIRVLFFPDAPSHSVSVSGVYSSGMTFFETVTVAAETE